MDTLGAPTHTPADHREHALDNALAHGDDLHHHLLIYHRSSCKVSAQIQLQALQRYYDKQNQLQLS